MKTRTILVAVDGTDTSQQALEWAVREAQRREALLRIAHAYEWENGWSRHGVTAEYHDLGREVAEAVLANAYHRAHELVPGITVETDLLAGRTVPRLLEIAHGAEMLVVGNRGRGGFTGLRLGSVSERMAMHAPCPVVVMRGRAGDVVGPVAAGLNTSLAADLVLETAFQTAAERHARLIIVHAYLPAVPIWIAGGVRPIDVSTAAQDTDEQAGIDERLAPWREKFPGVAVETILTHDSAAGALVAASRRARLVVIGSHGHNRMTGTLLGSTGLQLLHHADSPVMIVRGV